MNYFCFGIVKLLLTNKPNMTTEVNEIQMEENWCRLRPGIVVTHDGTVEPIFMTEDLLNPIEQIFLELIISYLLRRRDDGFLNNVYNSYIINKLGVPESSELNYWGTDPNSECKLLSSLFGSITKWSSTLSNYKETKPHLYNEDEITRYLSERGRDWREERIKTPRYSIKYISIELQILWYIKYYYFERFREPLIQWLQISECEFSPK